MFRSILAQKLIPFSEMLLLFPGIYLGGGIMTDFLPADKICKIAGITRRTLSTYIKNSNLTHEYRGKKLYVSESSFMSEFSGKVNRKKSDVISGSPKGVESYLAEIVKQNEKMIEQNRLIIEALNRDSGKVPGKVPGSNNAKNNPENNQKTGERKSKKEIVKQLLISSLGDDGLREALVYNDQPSSKKVYKYLKENDLTPNGVIGEKMIATFFNEFRKDGESFM